MIVELLREMGLTEYEAKAYAALLEFGALPCRRAASLSRVPSARVYDTLRSLAGKGLVVLIRKEPMTFEAVKPESALKQLIEKKSGYLRHVKDAVIGEAHKIGSKAPPEKTEFVEAHFGKERRFTRTLELHPQARKAIWVISRSETLPNALLREAKKDVKRGIDYRVITTQITGQNRAVLKNYLRAGVKLRYYPAIHGFNQVVFDRKVTYQVVFDPLNDDNVCVIVTHSPGLAESNAVFFESVWKKAEEVRF